MFRKITHGENMENPRGVSGVACIAKQGVWWQNQGELAGNYPYGPGTLIKQYEILIYF
jgi:hypothetical protein